MYIYIYIYICIDIYIDKYVCNVLIYIHIQEERMLAEAAAAALAIINGALIAEAKGTYICI
jgi:hypothetical protein